MDLKTVLPGGKGKQLKLQWSIVLEPGWVQSGLWYVENDVTKVVAIGTAVAWESPDELIESVDTTLSSAIQGTNLEGMDDPTEAVFGVPGSWVQDGQLSNTYLLKIKKICDEMDLKASGYVVLSEAIANFIKSDEGSIFSGVIIRPSEEMLDLSVYVDGVVENEQVIARSVSIVDDTKEGLVSAKLEKPLPPRFILYNGRQDELDDVKQNLIKHDWETDEEIKFLHAPTVEILDQEQKVLAVCLAGAAEMQSAKTVQKTFTAVAVTGGSTKTFTNEPNETDLKAEELVEEEQNIEEKNASELGFSVGEDVAGHAEDILEVDVKSKPQVVANEIPPQAHPVQQHASELPKEKAPGIFSRISRKISGIFRSFKIPGKKNLFIILPVIVLLVLLIGGVFAWWFLPQAEVTVYVSPKKIEESFDTQIDSATFTLADKSVEVTVLTSNQSAERTKSATGVQNVGEKAKGQVEIRNGTGDEIEVESGENIVSSGDLIFTLDESITVPAAESPTSPGSQSVAVTAGDIGSDYNLAKDETFAVSEFSKSEVDAIALTDFSGGSSSTVSAVSQDDLDTLHDELLEELTDNAIADLERQVDRNDTLIKEAIAVEIIKEEYDAQVGQEVDNVKLSMEIEASAVVVNEEDLYNAVSELLNEKIPEGFVLRPDQLVFSFDIEQTDEGELDGKVNITVNLLPQVDPEEIANTIAGSYPQVAQEKLKEIAGFAKVEIILNPSLPGRLGTLPNVPGNIEVQIAAEK